MTTLRCVLALAAHMDMDLVQMDVKTAFLHGDLQEEIYMQQPEGFEEEGKDKLVCRLNKSLYGLKQAPREWYHKFHSFMLSQGYQRSDTDHYLYTKKQARDGSLLILILYVDDMLIVGSNREDIASLKSKLNNAFDMKDLGELRYFLGIEVICTNEGIWLSQRQYALDMLTKYGMAKCKPITMPLD